MASTGERWRLGRRPALEGFGDRSKDRERGNDRALADAETGTLTDELPVVDLAALFAPYHGGVAPRMCGTYHPTKTAKDATNAAIPVRFSTAKTARGTSDNASPFRR
jgi:hypothetical protein